MVFAFPAAAPAVIGVIPHHIDAAIAAIRTGAKSQALFARNHLAASLNAGAVLCTLAPHVISVRVVRHIARPLGATKVVVEVEELYNSKRGEYYDSLQMGLPADFYSGRHDADHTRWIEYFVRVLYDASTQIGQQAERLYGAHAVDVPWSTLSRRQQQFLVRLSTRSLTHGAPAPSFTPSDVMNWFDVSRPTAYDWLDDWTNQCFIEPADDGLRIRRYRLAPSWAELLESVRLIAVARD